VFSKASRALRRRTDGQKVCRTLGSYEKLEPRHLLVTFNFVLSEAADQVDGLQLGLEEAATEWTTVLNDDVAVALDIDFVPLEGGVLAGTSPSVLREAYDTVRTALQTDSRSTEDESAAANLSQESNLVIYINFTEDNPSGAGSDVPYMDNDGGYNNQAIELTHANARALGLDSTGLIDASIAFNDQIAWDFDRSDGVDPEQFDFVGVVLHEMGHALGFLSTVDRINQLSLPGMSPAGFEDAMPPTSLDLYRHSVTSDAFGADLDLTVGGLQVGGDKTFFFDALLRGTFSTGLECITCDGNQASHWEDLAGYSQGLMDPTIGPGELGVISNQDLLAFDVIGWDLRIGGGGAGGDGGGGPPIPILVSGTVFNDANGSGLMEGQSGQAGHTVYHDLNENGVQDFGEASGQTNAEGVYQFVAIVPAAKPIVTSGGGSTEGGTPEGGTPEGGTPEGGTPEGGTPEGGTPEGGTPGCGTPEGGTPEGGTPEGGTPEGGTPEGGTDDCSVPIEYADRVPLSLRLVEGPGTIATTPPKLSFEMNPVTNLLDVNFGVQNNIDFGDATNVAPASAAITSGFHLGETVDGENASPAGEAATGDDADGDDEDGVVFPATALVPGASVTISVEGGSAAAFGFFQAWLDFNLDDDFDDAGEQIFSNVVLAAGDNQLTFTVPANAQTGTTTLRSRLGFEYNLGPTGHSFAGEVEDYQVELGSAGPGPFVLVPSQDLGTVDFMQLSNQEVSSGTLLEMTAAHSGLFTAEATFATPSVDVELQIFDEAGQRLGVSTPVDGISRLDVPVTVGDSLFLYFSGESTRADLHLVNLLAGTGSYYVYGSSQDDTFTYSPDRQQQLDINGMSYDLDVNSLDEITFYSGEGQDQLRVEGDWLAKPSESFWGHPLDVYARGDRVLRVSGNMPTVAVGLLGDLQQDGVLNAADVDQLLQGLQSGSQDVGLDLNVDGQVNQDDADFLIENVLQTAYGDTNLDGQVNLSDYTLLASNFSPSASDHGWAQGDLDGDGDTDLLDYSRFAANFGFRSSGQVAPDFQQSLSLRWPSNSEVVTAQALTASLGHLTGGVQTTLVTPADTTFEHFVSLSRPAIPSTKGFAPRGEMNGSRTGDFASRDSAIALLSSAPRQLEPQEEVDQLLLFQEDSTGLARRFIEPDEVEPLDFEEQTSEEQELEVLDQWFAAIASEAVATGESASNDDKGG